MRCLASEAIAGQTIEQAISQGVNHLETAKGYGNSEEYVGKAIKAGLKLPREQLYLTTKLPPTPDAEQMRCWLEASLKRLQLDYLDCLAIHGINTWEHLQWIEATDGCMQPILEALRDGRVKHVGFSTHGSLDLILATINTNLFEFINLHYYYFFQHNQPAIQLAHEKDMGIFIISPVDKGGRLYNPPLKLQQLCAPLSPLEFNYRFLLRDPRITTLSVGAATPEELINPLKLSECGEPLNPIELAIQARLEQELTQSLGTDLCSQCYQCLPCPENINIPEVLRLRNLTVAYDMQDFGEYRYRMFENAGHWFAGTKGSHCSDCGDCLPRCPQNLDIPALLRDTHQRLNGSPRRRLWG